MRAWIEISGTSPAVKMSTVALFMRAWIEITAQSYIRHSNNVALFMRAWIEMIKLDTPLIERKASPSS